MHSDEEIRKVIKDCIEGEHKDIFIPLFEKVIEKCNEQDRKREALKQRRIRDLIRKGGKY